MAERLAFDMAQAGASSPRPAPRASGKPAQLMDVDFSLAIHNRTGKYFIGQDLLATPGLPIAKVRYWYCAGRRVPTNLFGRIIGRLQLLHVRGHTVGGTLSAIPRRLSRLPLLHLDPFTVPTTVLRRSDAVLCHDLGPLTHPNLFDADVSEIYGHIYREIAEVGPHLIFVSEASMEMFGRLYPDANPASQRVIPPAIRSGINVERPQPVPGLEAPFFLTVGSIGTRKNQVKTIAAFARTGLASRGVRYVICGGKEPGHQEVAQAAEKTPGVMLLPYVNDAQLSWLYSNAAGFVLASQLEGFGMPIAEAIARGLVPLVSRDSVLHEVAGDGALLADPNDIDEIATKMEDLLELTEDDRARRLNLLHKSIERFSTERVRLAWQAAFRDMLG